jgi:hypothetical protein
MFVGCFLGGWPCCVDLCSVALMSISVFVLVSCFASVNRADEVPQPDLGLLACLLACPQDYRIQASSSNQSLFDQGVWCTVQR